MKSETLNKLMLAATLAAVVAAAAAVTMVVRISNRPDEARVQELIDQRLAQRESPATNAGLDEARVRKLIESQLPVTTKDAISEKEFNERVERGIEAYIAKQRREEQERPHRLAKNAPPPSKDDHVYGNPDAPIALIEYSDFECPYCKRFHDSVKQLVDGSNGKVSWIYRHFPLDGHNPGAEKQAEASECAAELGGNDGFWRFTDAIFARTRSGGRGFPVADLAPLAEELGMDKTKFNECLSSGRYADRVRQQLIDGQRAGINGTPGSILFDRRSGNVRAVIGAQPLSHLLRAVETLTQAKR
jgi:protein-disulfide isomerase